MSAAPDKRNGQERFFGEDRYHRLAAMADRLRAGKCPEGKILESLRALNSLKSSPPLLEADVQGIAAGERRQRTSGITVAALLSTPLPEIHPLCAPWVYEGVTLLAGAPKSGKTTLARQLAEAVGSGGDFLGSRCEQGRTTFLSLEEGPRLFRRKVQAMKITAEAADMIDVHFEWQQGFLGCERLAEHLRATPGTRLVVVDVFTKFRPPPEKNSTQYQADYDAMAGLSGVAKEFPGLAIVANHHTRKARSLDPMEDISGTFGLSGAADAFLVLRKQGAGGTLHAGGRLWELDESDFDLTRKDQRWHMNGVSDGLTDSERYVLRVLTEAGGMSPSELSKHLNCSTQNAHQRLKAIFGKGRAENRQGVYFPLTT